MARSLYDDSGNFVGANNYKTLFGTADILVAIRNNAIWVIVFPFMVTFIGLVFAVLTERIRWSTAFKTIVFMPMAISLFATGVIWRIVYETDPNRGVINAAVGTVANAINPPGLYALPNIKPISGLTAGGRRRHGEHRARSAPAARCSWASPASRRTRCRRRRRWRRQPVAVAGAVTGVVWRDFSPGGHIGVIDPDARRGCPGCALEPGGGRRAHRGHDHERQQRWFPLRQRVRRRLPRGRSTPPTSARRSAASTGSACSR